MSAIDVPALGQQKSPLPQMRPISNARGNGPARIPEGPARYPPGIGFSERTTTKGRSLLGIWPSQTIVGGSSRSALLKCEHVDLLLGNLVELLRCTLNSRFYGLLEHVARVPEANRHNNARHETLTITLAAARSDWRRGCRRMKVGSGWRTSDEVGRIAGFQVVSIPIGRQFDPDMMTGLSRFGGRPQSVPRRTSWRRGIFVPVRRQFNFDMTSGFRRSRWRRIHKLLRTPFDCCDVLSSTAAGSWGARPRFSIEVSIRAACSGTCELTISNPSSATASLCATCDGCLRSSSLST